MGDLIPFIDKRGRNNPSAARRQAEDQQRAAKADWLQQAAGTLFWHAQAAGRKGNAELADSILIERAGLVEVARKKGLLSQ